MPSYEEDIQTLSTGDFRSHVGEIVHTLQTDAELSGDLDTVGWTPDMTDDLAEALDAFDASVRTYRGLTGKKEDAADAFANDVGTFRRGPFRRHVYHVDAIFHDDLAIRRTLGISIDLNNLSTSFNTWAPLADDFYTHLTTDPDALQVLRGYDGLLDRLRDGHQQLRALVETKLTRDNLDDDRQQARRDRDAAREVVTHKFRHMQKFALASLFGSEKLGKVGYVHRSNDPQPVPET